MNRDSSPDPGLEKRSAILAALTKTRVDIDPSSQSSDQPELDANCYYTLSKEQVDALVSGNMEQIESWVSNLDRQQATRLLRWLIKEGV